MSLYLDTSVLVSIYVPEQHSKNILELLQKTGERPRLSRLAETEFYSALAMKKRTKELTETNINAIITVFNHHLAQLTYEKVYITDTVFEIAIQFLNENKTSLRTLDALHLACSSTINTTLVTADKTLAKNAKQFDIPIILL